MTRDEFEALPAAMRVRVLAQVVLDRKQLAEIKVSKQPLPPKFDSKIFRQGGFQWASETSIEGLRFWHKRAKEGATKGGEYAEKDRKNAADLERWIAWREWFPESAWQGERNRAPVTAAPPADKPRVHQHEARRRDPEPTYGDDDSDYSGADFGGDDDDVPYA